MSTISHYNIDKNYLYRCTYSSTLSTYKKYSCAAILKMSSKKLHFKYQSKSLIRTNEKHSYRKPKDGIEAKQSMSRSNSCSLDKNT